MRELDVDIWIHDDTVQLLGVDFGIRCTIVRLATGGLWVHSPTRLTAGLRHALANLGEVSAIIGPNNVHNLFLQAWCEAWPNADVWVSPGIPAKVPLAQCRLLQGDNPWPETFSAAYMGGVPMFDETVFLHLTSGSLIVTDFIQNHPDHPVGWRGALFGMLMRPLGFRGICTAPPLRFGFPIRDKDSFRRFVTRVREMQVARIVVTHGPVVEEGAQASLLALTERFVA